MSARALIMKTAAMVLLLASVACSSTFRRADALFSAGDYGQAAPAYEAALAGAQANAGTPRALYRLGVSRATPGTAGFDPAKAREAFENLRKRYPASAYAKEAALPLALLGEISAAEGRLATLKSELTKTQAETLAGAKAASEDSDRWQARVQKLQSTLAEQELTIERLRREMDQIKRIDLGQPR